MICSPKSRQLKNETTFGGLFMRSNNKHTVEELEKYIQLFLNEEVSFQELKNNYGLLLSRSVFSTKVLMFQEHGLEGIRSNTINNHYSKVFKNSVVEEHLELGIPVTRLARKYNIPSESTVRTWIIKYTKGKDFRVYSEKSEVYTMTGRKTTDDEKIIIVKDYLTRSLSYSEAAEKHNVSYNNIYSWVQKYKEHGPDGLIDRRGRRKLDSIQTDEEKLKTEIAALKARNEFLETENTALKKLKEVERELMLGKQNMKQNTKR